MYTRCPDCETIFRVSAEDLRRAQGKVRCGDCGQAFNAVEYLTEDPAAEEEQIPVLGGRPAEADDTLDPANDTGIHTLPDEFDPADDDYEFEITAYEKTGEAISALDPEDGADDLVSGEDPLHIDLEGDKFDADADEEIEAAFATMGESATIEMKAPLATEDLPTIEMPVPEDLRRDTDAGEARDENTDENADDEAAGPEDLDDSVWESIPGVGAAANDRTIDIATTDDETAAEDANDDAAADDELGFDVPEDKWASFFGSEPRPPGYEETDGSTEADLETTDAPRLGHMDSGVSPAVDAQALTDDGPAASEAAEDDEQLLQEMQAVFDATTDSTAADNGDAATNWHEQEPAEEVVMATGEFGSVEISSSLDDADEQPGQQTGRDDDWQPGDWQPGEDADDWQPRAAETTRRPLSAKMLLLGSLTVLLLGAGFIAQLVHYQRDDLAAHPAWGDDVRNAYAQLGMDLYPVWSTGSYEIRGSEAVAGESGPDVLDIRGQIASISDAAVGLPQLRVVLRDRWSNAVAARVFAPAEYAVEQLPADGLLQPNQTIDTHVAIVDPGSGAQGFELEVCLPRRDTGLECAGQGFE